MDAKTELKAKKIISSYLKYNRYAKDCNMGSNAFRGLKMADRKGIEDAVLAAGIALVDSAMLGVVFGADFCANNMKEYREYLAYGTNQEIDKISKYLANNIDLCSRIPFIGRRRAKRLELVLAQELGRQYRDN